MAGLHHGGRRLLPLQQNASTPSGHVLPRPTAPSRAQWDERRADIETLYTQKRWKLRHIMQYMEREYNFFAS